MDLDSIYSLKWLILFTFFCREVTGTAMFNPFNAPSQLLLSTDGRRLYLFVPPFLSNSSGIEQGQLLMVPLEGLSLNIQGSGESRDPGKYQLFENVYSSGNSPLSTTDTISPSADGSTVIIPMILPSKDNRHGRLLVLMGTSSCRSTPNSMSATAWEYFPGAALNTSMSETSIGKWSQLANRTWPGIAYWGRSFITNGLDRHPQVFLFGGLCATYKNHSVTNIEYFNTLESIYPDLAFHPPLPQYPNPPIPHAGFTITFLGHQSFLTHQYILIGGHSLDGFVGLDKVALFSHREQLSASVDGDQEEGWTYVRTFSSLSVHGSQHVDPRSGHASVLSADGKKVFVFGGWFRDVGDSGMAVAEPQIVILDIETNPELGWAWKTSNLSILGAKNELKHKGLFGHSAILLDHEVILVAGGYLFTNEVGEVERNTQVFMYNASSDSWITTYSPTKTFAIPPSPPTPDINGSVLSSSAKAHAIVVVSTVIATVFILCGVASFISWYRWKQKVKQKLKDLHHSSKTLGERGGFSEVAFPHSFGRNWSISSSRKSDSPFSFKSGEDVLSFFHLPGLRQPRSIQKERSRSFSPILEADNEDGGSLSLLRPDELSLNKMFSPTFPARAVSIGESIKKIQKRDTNNEIDEWQYLVRNYWKHVDFVKKLPKRSSEPFWTGSPVSTNGELAIQTEFGNEALNSGDDHKNKGIHDDIPPKRAASVSTTSSLSSKGSILANKISALLLQQQSSLTSPVPLSILKASNQACVHEDMSRDYFPVSAMLADSGRSEKNINIVQNSVVTSDTISLHTADTVSFTHSPINLENITSSFYTQQQAIKSPSHPRPLPVLPPQEEVNWAKVQSARGQDNSSNSSTALIAVPGLSFHSKPSSAHVNSSSPPSSPIYSSIISPQMTTTASPAHHRPQPSHMLSKSVLASTSPPTVSPVYSSSVYSSTHTAISEAERRGPLGGNSFSGNGVQDDIHHFRRDPTRSGAHPNGLNSNQCSFAPLACKKKNEEGGYPRFVSTANRIHGNGDGDGDRGRRNKKPWEKNDFQQKHGNNLPLLPPRAITPTTQSNSFSSVSPSGYQPASRLLPKPNSLRGNDVTRPKKIVTFDTSLPEATIGLGIDLDLAPGLFTKPNSQGSKDTISKKKYRSISHIQHGERNPPITSNYVARLLHNKLALTAKGAATGHRQTSSISGDYMKKEKQKNKEKNKGKEKEGDEEEENLNLVEEFKALRARDGRS